MKRTELEDLGLSSEQVDSVMKLHGKSMTKYADYDELKAQNSALSEQVSKNDKDLKSLKKQIKDNDPESLTNTIKQLQDENKQTKADYESKLNGMKLDNAVNTALSDARVRNNKAAKAMLDMDAVQLDENGNLTGLDDQLNGLKENSTWLFDQGENVNYDAQSGESLSESTEDEFFKAFGVEKQGDK